MSLVVYPKPPHPMRIPKNHSMLLLNVMNKNKNASKYDFHPLSYEHLELAQKRDPQLKKEFLNNTSKYKLNDFHATIIKQ
jgi:hypothetical protein